MSDGGATGGFSDMGGSSMGGGGISDPGIGFTGAGAEAWPNPHHAMHHHVNDHHRLMHHRPGYQRTPTSPVGWVIFVVVAIIFLIIFANAASTITDRGQFGSPGTHVEDLTDYPVPPPYAP